MKKSECDLSCVSDEKFEKKYQEIKEKITDEMTPVDKPIAVVLGGQPGAGKSTIYKIYGEQFGGNIVALDCDAFRQYHPNFKELHKVYGDNDGEKTNPFIFRVVDRLVDKLSEEGYNMIIESSLKSPHTAIENGEKLPKKGYSVELAVMATPKSESWNGTLERYNSVKASGGQPRAVPKEFHDMVVANIANSISEVYQSGLMSNILIFNRNKECLYDMSKTPDINPSKLLDDIINREQYIFKEISIDELDEHKNELSGLCQVGKSSDDVAVLKFKGSDKEKIEDILSNNQKLSKAMK